MLGRAEQLFAELIDSSAILALINQHEDAYLDCKEWHPRDTSPEKWLAKAICGLTNAEGGVLVIGLKAPSKPKDDPDIIESAAPVADTRLIKSRVLDLIGKNVEPGVLGIDVREIPDGVSDGSGFVVVFVHASEGSPRRSRVDWKFYQRIGSITLPMEYFQIEERFGVRPHPRLELFWEQKGYQANTFTRFPARQFVIGIRNVGAGIAKFPSIWFARSDGLGVKFGGIDGTGGFGLGLAPTEGELVAFRGGVNDVIYPDQTLKIAILVQQGENVGIEGISVAEYPMLLQRNGGTHHRWVFKATVFECHISCEGMETKRVKEMIPDGSVIVPNNY